MKKSLELVSNIIKQTDTSLNIIRTLQSTLLTLQDKLELYTPKPIVEKLHKTNNETIGQTSEQALSNVFGINSNIDPKRISTLYLDPLTNTLSAFKEAHPHIIITEALGSKNGDIDFKCKDGKTLSLKSLKSNSGKICPQVIGQPTLKKWDQINKFTEMPIGCPAHNLKRYEYIQTNITTYLNGMMNHLYCCDYLLVVYNCAYQPKWHLFNKMDTIDFFTNKELDISYSRPKYVETWNESKQKFNGFSTSIRLFYEEKQHTVGELQFHNCGRSGIKFRFNWKFLQKIYN
jgi:hypothetical protein